jgi:hypothetical protein
MFSFSLWKMSSEFEVYVGLTDGGSQHTQRLASIAWVIFTPCGQFLSSGGICYSPKIPYSFIHGLGPLTCIFFQSTAEKLFLKNHFLEDVRALHYYIPCTYVGFTTKNHVHTYATPLQPTYTLKSCKN